MRAAYPTLLEKIIDTFTHTTAIKTIRAITASLCAAPATASGEKLSAPDKNIISQTTGKSLVVQIL
jgi:hypothetical protein